MQEDVQYSRYYKESAVYLASKENLQKLNKHIFMENKEFN